MLEVDEDSRLGASLWPAACAIMRTKSRMKKRWLISILHACERLQSAGIAQYEISNFAREGFESQHNLKYWTRQPYLGFGVDAHSMLESATARDIEAVRFAPQTPWKSI
jgi:oxygen-independent coproporphyrinogen III oxidase